MKLAELAAGAVLSYVISQLFTKKPQRPLIREESLPVPPAPIVTRSTAPIVTPAQIPAAQIPPERILWPTEKAAAIPQASDMPTPLLENAFSRPKPPMFQPIMTSTAEPQTEARAVAAREKKPFDRSYWMPAKRVTPEMITKSKALLSTWRKGGYAFDGPRTFAGRRQYRAAMHGTKKAIEVWVPKPPFV